jgi:coenzyme F420-0:L-glutamate ligase/coenzyme F420-1:gamma-L-glutamate ligase
MPSAGSGGALLIVPVTGVGEVVRGTDLAAVLLAAMAGTGLEVRAGDCLVVSSKVVSKTLGLAWRGGKADAVGTETVRVVAERRGDAGITQVVESVSGPVMAAAGVDGSNTGPSSRLLLLPGEPDTEAARLRDDLLAALGLPASAPLAVVLSDTAGRPWRNGLTDFALGAAGLHVIEDLRGRSDHDGRPLTVTTRALADEVAAAADLVKGKADGIPAALVRGLPATWFAGDAQGARSLLRTGPGDWFALGHVEAVRQALGVAAGSSAAREVGVPSTRTDEPFPTRVGRVVALALRDVPGGSADVGLEEPAESAEVTLGAADDYDLGRLVTRCQVAAFSEAMEATLVGRPPGAVVVRLVDGT